MKLLAWSYGLILFLLPSYLLRFNIQGIPTTALEVIIGMFLLAVFFRAINKQSFEKIKSLGKVNWAVGLFVVASIISVLVSPDQIKALGQLKAFIIEPILLFYAGVLILNRDNINSVLRGLFCSAVFISLFGIIQYWTHLFLPLRFWGYGLEVKRITSVFQYPNALALYLSPLFVFYLALKVRGYELMKKYWSWLGLILMFTATILTYSRGAWIAIFVCSIVITLTAIRIPVRKLIIWGLVIGIVLSPLVVPRLNLLLNDGSSTERLSLYQAAWDKIKTSPITGNGLYGFRSTLEQSENYKGEILNYPHNIILNFWVETGVFGLIAFILLIFFAYRNYTKSPTTLKFAGGLFLLALITHGMFDAPYFKNDLSILFWFMLSLFFI